MVTSNLPLLSTEEAVRKIMAKEPISGYYIPELDLHQQDIPGSLIVEECQIGTLTLVDAKVAGQTSFKKSCFSGEVVCGWKSPFHKTGIAIFEGQVSFTKCTFQDKVFFGGAHFSSIASFQNSVFQKDASFRQAEFKEQAWLGECKFSEDADFTGCKFCLEAHFDSTNFGHDVFFDNVNFLQKDFSFNEVRVNGNISFQDCHFECVTGVRKTIVDGEVDFRNSIFEQDSDFSDARFKGKFSLRNVTFKNKVLFIHTIFENMASFLGVQFHETNFLNSQFQDEAFFNYDRHSRASLKEGNVFAQFHGVCDFTNVRFHKRAVFEEVVFERSATFANSYFGEQASFIDASFKGPASFNNVYCNQELSAIGTTFGDVTFDYANINRRLDLSDAQMSSISFYKAALDLIVVSQNQIRRKMLNEKPESPQYRRAKEEYLLLKKSFQQRGLYHEEDWAYRKFRQMQRRASSQTAWAVITGKSKEFGFFSAWPRLFWNFLERIVADRGTGYGTQPLNITIVALFIVVLFAFAYTQFSGELVYDKKYPFQFFQALYFSITTFTTMGFGDVYPRPDSLMCYVVSAEAFVGIFIMTLFVGTYTRKIIR